MAAQVMNINNHTKRTTVSDYMVGVTLPFTDEHKDINKKFINSDTRPELLTAVEHMGLTYRDTELKEMHELDKARTHALLQKFRRGLNPEYSNIQKDVHVIGMIKKIELWNPTVLNEKDDGSGNVEDKDFDDLADEINF